jgi:hypothetical protein
MQRQVYGVRQATTRDCGAAACKYIMIMLGVGQIGEPLGPIMKEVRTVGINVRGSTAGINWLGSTPTNIGNLIKKRCAAAGVHVTVERANGHNPVGNVGGRGYLYVLGPAMLKFNASSIASNDPHVTINWTKGQGAPNLAILRMIGKQEGAGPNPIGLYRRTSMAEYK